ncbi:hypothetical protein HZB01_01830 [Candidatus Woesearchaeota archaeon]|nr:hypothetical protein [Candidatus Woesearchaeota archaeon]
MVDQAKFLQLIKTKGPVVPVDLTKETGMNTIFIGAIFSDMISKGLLQISNMKMGGSPLYYLKEHTYRLQDFAKFLNEKDKRTYDLLKEKKVLRDIDQTPLVRVSLTNIKDFAVPLRVNISEQQQELFWKWYLLSTEDAERIIRSMVGKPKLESPQQQQTELPKAPQSQPEPPQPVPEQKQSLPPPSATTPPSPKSQPSPKPVVQETLALLEPKIEEKPTEKKQEKRELDTKTETPSFIIPKQEPDSKLYKQAKKFFDHKEIILENIQANKKGNDIEAIAQVPSAVGHLIFYCRILQKTRVSDADLNASYIRAQHKKLPALLLVDGELSKKAKDMVENEFKHSMVVRLI